MVKAIIVDDEPDCCESLAILLERYCPQVNIAAICQNSNEALALIKQQQPHILFLDIEMPYMNGFELLEEIGNISFEVIFTTSYDHYAIKAFRISALDYLLKPIDREELQKAVEKATRRLQGPLPQQLEIFLQKMQQPSAHIQNIALPTLEGLEMVAIDSIIRCESDSNYTAVILKSKQKMIVSRTLKEVERILEEYLFLRVHHSHLINLNEINKYIRGEGGYLVMSDGSSVDVSRSKKETLLKKLQPGKH